MTYEEIAASILACLGGTTNIEANALCMTRLRVNVYKPSLIDEHGLVGISGVLGMLKRGDKSFEIVCRPAKIAHIFQAFCGLTNLPNDLSITLDDAPDTRVFDVHVANTVSDPLAKTAKHSATTANDEIGIKPENKRAQNLPTSPSGTQSSSAVRERVSRNSDTRFMRCGLSEAEELTRMLLASDNTQDKPTITKQHMWLEDDLLDNEMQDVDLSTKTNNDQQKADTMPHADTHLLVLNGPNINLLGIREPQLYGKHDYLYLVDLCETTAHSLGFSSCVCFQSNHEGELIDAIQQARGVYAGIIFNPAAYTHTSIALLDAISAVEIPTIEVHISDVSAREDFRQISYIRKACIATITGKGLQGYVEAIHTMAHYLGITRSVS